LDFEGKSPASFHNVCSPFESHSISSYATHPFHLMLVAATSNSSASPSPRHQHPARRPRIHLPVLVDDRHASTKSIKPAHDDRAVQASLSQHALQAIVSAKVGGRFTFSIFADEVKEEDDDDDGDGGSCAFRIRVEVESQPNPDDLSAQEQCVSIMRKTLETQFEYHTMQFCGWTVHVQNRLMCDDAKSQMALDLLRDDLQSMIFNIFL
jgi:hypothetical protein